MVSHGLNAALLPPLIACEPKNAVFTAQDHDLRSASSPGEAMDEAEVVSAPQMETRNRHAEAAESSAPKATAKQKGRRKRRPGITSDLGAKPEANGIVEPSLRRLTEAECESCACCVDH